jgi:drug/metabolite transporter (DMT)-like permease
MLIQNIKKESIGYLSAIIAAILFGSVSTITKPVLEDQNALSISSLLYIIAGLSLMPFLKLYHRLILIILFPLNLVLIKKEIENIFCL